QLAYAIQIDPNKCMDQILYLDLNLPDLIFYEFGSDLTIRSGLDLDSDQICRILAFIN
ncbi:6767_t:CDS:1, partial [Dentiscutata erythropus]